MKHRVRVIALALAAAILGTAHLAHAETHSVEAAGEADAGSESARVRAIDSALAEAVGRTLVQVVDGELRRRHGKALNDHVVRRARLFVAGFKVVDEQEVEGRLEVRITARVDLDKLRDKLDELGIPATPASEIPVARPRPKVVVLVHATLGDTTATTFGQAAEAEPGGAAGQSLLGALKARGFEIVSAAGAPVPVSQETLWGMPLSDTAAAELARSVGAGGAFVVGLEALPEGPIRGTQLVGATGRAAIRVLDVAGPSAALVAQAEVQGAGFAGAVEDALARAASDLAQRLVRAIDTAVADYWPLLAASKQSLLVQVSDFQGWSQVRLLVEHLAGTRGIERVWPRHLGRGTMVLAVDTELGRRRVASALRRVELPGARVSVGSWGEDGLRASVRASPPETEIAP